MRAASVARPTRPEERKSAYRARRSTTGFRSIVRTLRSLKADLERRLWPDRSEQLKQLVGLDPLAVGPQDGALRAARCVDIAAGMLRTRGRVPSADSPPLVCYMGGMVAGFYGLRRPPLEALRDMPDDTWRTDWTAPELETLIALGYRHGAGIRAGS